MRMFSNPQRKPHHCFNEGSPSNTGQLPNSRSSLGALLSLSQPKPFVCSKCSKTFSCWQALGGHQNAHKKERNMESKLEQARNTQILSLAPRLPQPTCGQNIDHLVMPSLQAAAKPRFIFGPQVGFGSGSQHEKGFKPGLKVGSIGSGPIRASHGNHLYHPYQKPSAGKKLMPWGLNPSPESESMSMARTGARLEDSPQASDAESSTNNDKFSGSYGDVELKSRMKKLDLTLKL